MTAARETVAAIATERERGFFGHCIYCGHHTYGLACSDHRDLLTVDTHTYAMRLRSTSPAEKGSPS